MGGVMSERQRAPDSEEYDDIAVWMWQKEHKRKKEEEKLQARRKKQEAGSLPSLLKMGIPVLTGLSRIIMDPHRLDVRTSALNGLFGILRTRGALFSSKLWQLVLRGVLFPIFDDVKYACEYVENDWLQTTCFSAFHLLIELFAQFYADLSDLVFHDLLELISHAMKQDDSRVASIGVACYISFVNAVEKHPSAEQWQQIVDVLVDAIGSSSIAELQPKTGAEADGAAQPTHEMIKQIERKSEYMQAVEPLAMSHSCALYPMTLRRLVSELLATHAVLAACNTDTEWLTQSGWAAKVDELSKHEMIAFSSVLMLLREMCASQKLPTPSEYVDVLSNLLLGALDELLQPEKSTERRIASIEKATVAALDERTLAALVLASEDISARLSAVAESPASDALKRAAADALRS